MKGTIRRASRRRKKPYIDRPRGSRWPVYVTCALLTGMLAVSLWGVAVIDRNSSLMGWNRRPTEFAVSIVPEKDRLAVTVFGRSYGLSLGRADLVEKAAVRAAGAAQYGRPALLREGRLLLNMGIRHAEFIRRAFQILRSGE